MDGEGGGEDDGGGGFDFGGGEGEGEGKGGGGDGSPGQLQPEQSQLYLESCAVIRRTVVGPNCIAAGDTLGAVVNSACTAE